MIVANVAVALSPSCRASRYGRITSPARAGSTALAANPIVVVRNAGRKPRVADRREQVLPPKRAQHHRQHGDGRRQRDQPRVRRCLISAQTTSRWAPRRKSASSPTDSTTMTTVRSDFLMNSGRKQRVYYKGGCGECQERISSGVAQACQYRVLDKIGAFPPSPRGSRIAIVVVSFSKHLLTA